jgi:hypothetical protein
MTEMNTTQKKWATKLVFEKINSFANSDPGDVGEDVVKFAGFLKSELFNAGIDTTIEDVLPVIDPVILQIILIVASIIFKDNPFIGDLIKRILDVWFLVRTNGRDFKFPANQNPVECANLASLLHKLSQNLPTTSVSNCVGIRIKPHEPSPSSEAPDDGGD